MFDTNGLRIWFSPGTKHPLDRQHFRSAMDRGRGIGAMSRDARACRSWLADLSDGLFRRSASSWNYWTRRRADACRAFPRFARYDAGAGHTEFWRVLWADQRTHDGRERILGI